MLDQDKFSKKIHDYEEALPHSVLLRNTRWNTKTVRDLANTLRKAERIRFVRVKTGLHYVEFDDSRFENWFKSHNRKPLLATSYEKTSRG